MVLQRRLGLLHLCATVCKVNSTGNECQLHTSELMQKTSAISVRVTEKTKQAIEKLAKKDGRSVASYVDRLLVAHIEEQSASSED